MCIDVGISLPMIHVRCMLFRWDDAAAAFDRVGAATSSLMTTVSTHDASVRLIAILLPSS